MVQGVPKSSVPKELNEGFGMQKDQPQFMRTKWPTHSDHGVGMGRARKINAVECSERAND